MRVRRNLKEKIATLRGGGIPQVSRNEYLYAEQPGDTPGVETRAVRRLSRTIHWAESHDCAISWDAQQRALDYYNAHGLAATLDEATRYEARRLTPESGHEG